MNLLTSIPLPQYGVLDLLVKVFWLFSFLFSIEDVPYDIYGFRSSKVTDVAPSSERGVRSPSSSAPARRDLGSPSSEKRAQGKTSATSGAQPSAGTTAAAS